MLFYHTDINSVCLDFVIFYPLFRDRVPSSLIRFATFFSGLVSLVCLILTIVYFVEEGMTRIDWIVPIVFKITHGVANYTNCSNSII